MSTDIYAKRQELLSKLPKLPQRQDGDMDQLRDLWPVAIYLGLLEAANSINAVWNVSSDHNPSIELDFEALDMCIDSQETQPLILCAVANKLGMYDATDSIKAYWNLQ